jgi:hypothetical protein
MEINGFKVDKENIYGLNTNAKESTCPICSATRSKSKEKCMTLHWDTGLGICHHCGVRLQLHTFTSKKATKVYSLPEWKNNTDLSENLVKWFEKRGISQFTLRLMKITEGKEWIPQTGKLENTVQFNYFRNNQLINIKYRDGAKNFKMHKDSERIFYNLDGINISNEVIIVEGECFDGKAMVLTQRGWIHLSSLQESDLVCIVDENKNLSFEKPLQYIKKHYNGKMIDLEGKGYSSFTTEKHNLVLESKKTGLVKKEANVIKNQALSIPRAGFYNGSGLNVSDDTLRLLIAISADFTLRKGGDIYGSFKKERKYLRIKQLLESLNIKHCINKDSRDYWSVFIHRNHGLDAFKLFPMDWISKLSKHQIELILEEIIFWDGNSVNGRTMTEFNSKEINNIEFIQTLCHLSGRCSSIVRRKNKYGSWYKATILNNKSKTSLQRLKKEIVDWNDYVYCVTVSTGMILVKQNEHITISGNCDALSFIECGIHNVVSVPNGSTIGTANLEYLDNCIEYFDNKDKIYLALDNDEAGKSTTKELIRRLGSDKCFLVDFNDCKDANEYLTTYGKESLLETLKNAKEIPIDGVSSLYDWQKEFQEYLVNGMQSGFKIGLKSFDDIFSTYTGQYIVVTGKPSCFTEDQEIITEFGSKKISQLNINDKVLSYNEKTKQNEYCKVVNTMVNDNTQDKIYKITMKDGTIIKVTENHLFFNGISYVKIKDLLLSTGKLKN